MSILVVLATVYISFSIAFLIWSIAFREKRHRSRIFPIAIALDQMLIEYEGKQSRHWYFMKEWEKRNR